jgi:hypothetical protein
MFYGYRILAAMMEMVVGNADLVSQITAASPDLIVGDAVGAYGHWLTGLTGIPAVEFDVGTSSGMLHSGLWGGQLNPAYVPAPGGCGWPAGRGGAGRRPASLGAGRPGVRASGLVAW